MYKVIGIAVAVVVFIALVALALLKAGWVVITKIADTNKRNVAWEGPRVRVTKKDAEAAA